MASEYTPTTEDVFDAYRRLIVWARGTSDGATAEFDRWLAEVRREAAAEAILKAADELVIPAQGPAHYVDVWWAEEQAIEWLRARAAQYREKGQ